MESNLFDSILESGRQEFLCEEAHNRVRARAITARAITARAITAMVQTKTAETKSKPCGEGKGRKKIKKGNWVSDTLLVCDKCPYNTTYKCDFRRHKLRHGAMDFPCKDCNMPFATKGHLRGHCRSTHGTDITGYERDADIAKMRYRERYATRRKKCDKCDYVTAVPSDLRKHMKLHDEAVVDCQYCHRPFTQGSLYRIHLRKKHGENSVDEPFLTIASPFDESRQPIESKKQYVVKKIKTEVNNNEGDSEQIKPKPAKQQKRVRFFIHSSKGDAPPSSAPVPSPVITNKPPTVVNPRRRYLPIPRVYHLEKPKLFADMTAVPTENEKDISVKMERTSHEKLGEAVNMNGNAFRADSHPDSTDNVADIKHTDVKYERPKCTYDVHEATVHLQETLSLPKMAWPTAAERNADRKLKERQYKEQLLKLQLSVRGDSYQQSDVKVEKSGEDKCQTQTSSTRFSINRERRKEEVRVKGMSKFPSTVGKLIEKKGKDVCEKLSRMWPQSRHGVKPTEIPPKATYTILKPIDTVQYPDTISTETAVWQKRCMSAVSMPTQRTHNRSIWGQGLFVRADTARILNNDGYSDVSISKDRKYRPASVCVTRQESHYSLERHSTAPLCKQGTAPELGTSESDDVVPKRRSTAVKKASIPCSFCGYRTSSYQTLRKHLDDHDLDYGIANSETVTEFRYSNKNSSADVIQDTTGNNSSDGYGTDTHEEKYIIDARKRLETLAGNTLFSDIEVCDELDRVKIDLSKLICESDNLNVNSNNPEKAVYRETSTSGRPTKVIETVSSVREETETDNGIKADEHNGPGDSEDDSIAEADDRKVTIGESEFRYMVKNGFVKYIDPTDNELISQEEDDDSDNTALLCCMLPVPSNSPTSTLDSEIDDLHDHGVQTGKFEKAARNPKRKRSVGDSQDVSESNKTTIDDGRDDTLGQDENTTDEPAFSCIDCDFTTTHMVTLKKHINQHMLGLLGGFEGELSDEEADSDDDDDDDDDDDNDSHAERESSNNVRQTFIASIPDEKCASLQNVRMSTTNSGVQDESISVKVERTEDSDSDTDSTPEEASETDLSETEQCERNGDAAIKSDSDIFLSDSSVAELSEEEQDEEIETMTNELLRQAGLSEFVDNTGHETMYEPSDERYPLSRTSRLSEVSDSSSLSGSGENLTSASPSNDMMNSETSSPRSMATPAAASHQTNDMTNTRTSSHRPTSEGTSGTCSHQSLTGRMCKKQFKQHGKFFAQSNNDASGIEDIHDNEDDMYECLICENDNMFEGLEKVRTHFEQQHRQLRDTICNSCTYCSSPFPPVTD